MKEREFNANHSELWNCLHVLCDNADSVRTDFENMSDEELEECVAMVNRIKDWAHIEKSARNLRDKLGTNLDLAREYLGIAYEER